MTYWLLGTEVCKAWQNEDLQKVLLHLEGGEGMLHIMPCIPAEADFDVFSGWLEQCSITEGEYLSLHAKLRVSQVYLVYTCNCRHERSSYDLVRVCHGIGSVLRAVKDHAEVCDFKLPAEYESHLLGMKQTQLMNGENEMPHEYIFEEERIDFGHV